MPSLSGSELAEWVATVDPADPLLRHFAAELRDLGAAGADPRWAMIVLSRRTQRIRTRGGVGRG